MSHNPIAGEHLGRNEDTDSEGLPQSPEARKAEAEYYKNESAKKEAALKGEFPGYALPDPIQFIMESTGKALNFLPDYIGSAILFAASVATGNTYRVQYSAHRQTSAVLYIALVGRPGINKSQPLEFAIKPIQDSDTASYLIYQTERTAYDLKMKSLSKDSEPPIEPVFSKFLLSDFTIEALTQVHSFNLRGIGVYCDELASWVKNFNRYNSGSDQEFWLATWTGSPIRIDRKKDRPLFIATPFISVGGTIQPSVLKEMGKHDRSQNGFIDRMLFSFPPDSGRDPWSETELDPAIGDKWQTILNRILKLGIEKDQDGQPKPSILKFSPGAKGLVKAFQATNTQNINLTSDDAIRGILAKFDIYVLRLALLLEMLAYGCELSELMDISERSAQGAIDLCHYFISTAKRVNATISPKSHPVEKLTQDKQILYSQLPDEFSAEIGIDIADGIGISRSAFYRLMDNPIGEELFLRTKRGLYCKIDHTHLGQPGRPGQDSSH